MKNTAEFSPEEKLLRLIRGSKFHQQRRFSSSKLKNVFSVFKRGFSLRYLLISLYTLVALTTLIFLGYKLLKPVSLSFIEEPQQLKENLGFNLTKPKPFSYYETAFRKQNLFKADYSQVAKNPLKKASNIEEFLKDLSLVGILWTDSPQAIIEDKKTQKSYFLNKGDSIQGFRIVDIQRTKIILEYQGERFELFL